MTHRDILDAMGSMASDKEADAMAEILKEHGFESPFDVPEKIWATVLIPEAVNRVHSTAYTVHVHDDVTEDFTLYGKRYLDVLTQLRCPSRWAHDEDPFQITATITNTRSGMERVATVTVRPGKATRTK